MSEEKKKEPPAAPKPHAVKETHTHGKKVAKISLSEMDEAIALCKKQQGGLWSRYGQSLVGRKAALSVSSSMPLKKAA